MAVKKQALGRGLNALLSSENEKKTIDIIDKDSPVLGQIAEININLIEVNPFQPRKIFDELSLSELSESIKNHGIIQPISVRKLEKERFQLISGERRLKAAKLAKLKKIPAYIKIANDKSMLEFALIENIQREDLDAIEIATSYQRLIHELKFTQEKLSERVSKKRSTITNYLRLLKLPDEIQNGIREKLINMGHARALINIEKKEDMISIFYKIAKEGLSVRAVEEIAKNLKRGKTKNKENIKDEKYKTLTFEQEKHKEELSKILNTKLQIKKDKKGKGSIIIPFETDSDLLIILSVLNS